MKQGIVYGIVASSIVTSLVALAKPEDGKPYDWKDFSSIVDRDNPRQESICGSVAKNMQIRDLVCTIDHSSWDKFAAAEFKFRQNRKPDFDKPETNGVDPWSCQGALNFFRSYGDGGHIPSPSDLPAVAAEYQQKITSFNCVMDYVDKPKSLTYDAAKKQLTFHFTRETTSNNAWIGAFLEDDEKMVATFPQLVKFLKTQNL